MKTEKKQSGWVAAFKFVPLMVFALLVIIFKMDLLLAAPIQRKTNRSIAQAQQELNSQQ